MSFPLSPYAYGNAAAMAGVAGQAPATVEFSTQPGNVTAGEVFAQQPVVRVKDIDGNVLTSFSGKVYIFITINPIGGTSESLTSPTLTPEPEQAPGAYSLNATAGVATFTDLGIAADAVTGTYELEAFIQPEVVPLVSVQSADFTVEEASASNQQLLPAQASNNLLI